MASVCISSGPFPNTFSIILAKLFTNTLPLYILPFTSTSAVMWNWDVVRILISMLIESHHYLVTLK